MVSPLLPPGVHVCQELDDLVLQYMALIDEHLSALNRVSDRFQQVQHSLGAPRSTLVTLFWTFATCTRGRRETDMMSLVDSFHCAP